MFNQEIGSLSLEALVGLLLDNDHDIARLGTRELVSFSVEGVLAVVGGTLVNSHIDDLLLFVDFLSLASLALVGFVNDFALAAAVVTRSLGLRVHAGSELGHASHHTAATAGCALLDSAFFASEPGTLSANALSVYSNLGCLTRVDFFESALKRVHHGLALLGACGTTTGSATTTEHLAEEVVHAAGSAALFEAILTVLVVPFALLLVREHFVGTLDFLELVFVTTTVGVMGLGKFEVGLLDGAVISLLVNSENVVELRVVDLLGGTATAGHAAHLLKVSEGESSASSAKEHVCSVCLIDIIF